MWQVWAKDSSISMTMTVPSESDSQKQQTVVVATTTRGGAVTVNPPKFRRIYSNTFSTIVWGASASSIIAGSSIKGNKPEDGDVPSSAGSITRTTTQSSSSGRFGFASRLSSAYSSSSSLDTFATRKGGVVPNYYGHHGEVVVKQVPTKGEASSEVQGRAILTKRRR